MKQYEKVYILSILVRKFFMIAYYFLYKTYKIQVPVIKKTAYTVGRKVKVSG